MSSSVENADSFYVHAFLFRVRPVPAVVGLVVSTYLEFLGMQSAGVPVNHRILVRERTPESSSIALTEIPFLLSMCLSKALQTN